MAKRKAAGKGSSFERLVCKALSMWVTRGKRADVFWRTAMSGGRSTVARRNGQVVRQSGDICAVSYEGAPLLEEWYIECKRYRRIDFGQWVLNDQGKIAKWWRRAKLEARQCGKEPMLIVKQNAWPIIVITRHTGFGLWEMCQCRVFARRADVSLFSDMIETKYYPKGKFIKGAEL